MTFELEGMALGKPVIAYVSAKLCDNYKPPIFMTTMQNLRQDLEALIQDTSTKQKVSKKGNRICKEISLPRKNRCDAGRSIQTNESKFQGPSLLCIKILSIYRN